MLGGAVVALGLAWYADLRTAGSDAGSDAGDDAGNAVDETMPTAALAD